uniref:Putative secreted protein n=1 Tax=Rhipicephalus microplus TaxID=6941 RepID=A0A6G5A4V1_RHIMP
MHFGTKTCIFMLFSAVLASAPRSRETKTAAVKVPRARMRRYPAKLGVMVNKTETRTTFGITEVVPWIQAGPFSGKEAATTMSKAGRLNAWLLWPSTQGRNSRSPIKDPGLRVKTNRPCNKQ